MLAAFGVAAGGSLDALGDAGDRLRGAALGAALGYGVQTFGRSGRVTVCWTGAAGG